MANFIEKVLKNLKYWCSWHENDKILLGLSGGGDSVALFHILRKLAIPFECIHCNFQLRGKESLQDEEFVKKLCFEHNIPLEVVTFDTKSYSKSQKISIEMAARELRYSAFYKVAQNKKIPWIAVASNLDDLVETFFFNLLRGTGIGGLKSIMPVRDKVIRPLFNIPREEIRSFLTQNNLSWREDSSNESPEFLRNRIRHHILTFFKSENPQFLENFSLMLNYLREAFSIYEYSVKEELNRIIEPVFFPLSTRIIGEKIDLLKLKEKKKWLLSLTYEWLKKWQLPYEKIREIEETLLNASYSNEKKWKKYEGPNGFVYLSSQEIAVLKRNIESPSFKVNSIPFTIDYPIKLLIQNETRENANFTANLPPSSWIVDFEKIYLPLTFEPWQDGDTVFLYKRNIKKKISDFLNEKKIPLYLKKFFYKVIDAQGNFLGLFPFSETLNPSLLGNFKKATVFKVLI